MKVVMNAVMKITVDANLARFGMTVQMINKQKWNI
jgi:hypothetical protein